MRIRWMLSGAVAVSALVIGIGVVAAQSGDEEGDSFLDRVAAKLGVEPDRLEQAVRDVGEERIDEAVASGDITEERAERLRERLENAPLDGFAPFRRGHSMAPRLRRHAPCIGRMVSPLAAQDGIADLLGLTRPELRAELSAEGATLATVAESHGTSRDELIAFMRGRVQERLDGRVADGEITQAQADECTERFDNVVERLVDAELRFPRRNSGMPFRQGPDSEGAAPQSGRVPTFAQS